jgi:hypothetical protein
VKADGAVRGMCAMVGVDINGVEPSTVFIVYSLEGTSSIVRTNVMQFCNVASGSQMTHFIFLKFVGPVYTASEV